MGCKQSFKFSSRFLKFNVGSKMAERLKKGKMSVESIVK